ncbi:sterol regulatory element binding protein cleavage-activating protein [Favolaschia claudopus]|uniref:Sterol regulatory element binding protein cleavage-activating protein n=1 Tax=Favolaschia claudopus TaxID=2862362 RepID=A0AAW0B1A2_9AGAR
MQAPVYSTATDVKIHQAIRRQWAAFQAWLIEQHRRLEYHENEILLAAAHRRRGKMKDVDVEQQIHALEAELLAAARGEWLARVRNNLLHLEHWVMTPDEKRILQQALGWTHKDMVDAYAKQQAEMGAMYQRVDPTTLGKRDSVLHGRGPSSPSRFKHPVVPESAPPVLAYENWAAEVSKLAAASPLKPPKSIQSIETPSMPLYFVGALLQGTDLDAVAASDLEAFALHISEEKIREYYAEACEAAVHFQRGLAAVEPARRDEAHEDFERYMQELKSAKEREWKAVTVKELRKHQAASLQHRAAQQRAMRPPPRKKHRGRENREWGQLDEFYQSPRRRSATATATPSTYRSPRQGYLDAYHRSPPREPLHAYHSPRQYAEEEYYSPLIESRSTETYRSPRRRRRKQPSVVEEEEEEEEEEEVNPKRGILGSIELRSRVAANTLRNGGLLSRGLSGRRIPGTAPAPADWSSAHVGEVDFKKPPGLNPSQNAQGLDFVLRLAGTASQPRPAREKLRKRKASVVETRAEPAQQRLGGTAFRRGVSDAKPEIRMAEKIQLEPRRKGEGKSQPNQFGHWLGGSGPGLGPRVNEEKRSVAIGQKPQQTSEAIKGRNVNLPPPSSKRVRFKSPTLSSSTNFDMARVKQPGIRKSNFNGVTTKFYEKLGSKASTTAS